MTEQGTANEMISAIRQGGEVCANSYCRAGELVAEFDVLRGQLAQARNERDTEAAIRARLEGERDEARRESFERITALHLVLRDLLDDQAVECRFDHEGYCQAHGASKPCKVAAARQVLEEG